MTNLSDDILILATSSLKQDYENTITRQIYPRVEYVELAKHLNVKYLNYSLYESLPFGKRIKKLETFLRTDISLALAAVHQAKTKQPLLAMSERVGIVLAALKKLRLITNKLIFRFTAWSDRQHWIFRRFDLLPVPGNDR